jgi:hypothetical protein
VAEIFEIAMEESGNSEQKIGHSFKNIKKSKLVSTNFLPIFYRIKNCSTVKMPNEAFLNFYVMNMRARA